MDKLANAIKATCIVLGVCCAGVGALMFGGVIKVAGSALLGLLVLVAPVLVIGLAIGFVYAFLEGRS